MLKQSKRSVIKCQTGAGLYYVPDPLQLDQALSNNGMSMVTAAYHCVLHSVRLASCEPLWEVCSAMTGLKPIHMEGL